MDWEELENNVAQCHKCGLCNGRKNVVVGRGSKTTGQILFVGEGPGANEDNEGLPFVGQAGRLMNMCFDALGLKEENCYITNVVKCRPPENRNPEERECAACMPYLRTQYALLKPRIVVCLGAVAASHLIEPGKSISALRCNWVKKGGALFLATYHPAALLRDQSKKIDFYNDMQEVLRMYNEINGKSENNG